MSEKLKRQAAERALEYVEPGMRLGLGTGSTAAHFVELLAERVRGGLSDIIGVPTSEATRALAERLGIRLATLDEFPELDLTVDGADEIDRQLQMIKGGGGALLREKIVARASERVVIIADHSKLVDTLGAHPLPLEVVPFGVKATRNMVKLMAANAGCENGISLRMGADGKPFLTDNGNLILDCTFGRIERPEEFDQSLKLVPGVVETGLFVRIADIAIIAKPDAIEVMERRDEE